jgi:hypothetical protein
MHRHIICVNHMVMLHPAFGLDEDWNIAVYNKLLMYCGGRCIQHLGWMRIGTAVDVHLKTSEQLCCIQPLGWMRIGTLYRLRCMGFLLHPAFGLDEDWNKPLLPSGLNWLLGCIQPLGWMRIGTIIAVT